MANIRKAPSRLGTSMVRLVSRARRTFCTRTGIHQTPAAPPFCPHPTSALQRPRPHARTWTPRWKYVHNPCPLPCPRSAAAAAPGARGGCSGGGACLRPILSSPPAARTTNRGGGLLDEGCHQQTSAGSTRSLCMHVWTCRVCGAVRCHRSAALLLDLAPPPPLPQEEPERAATHVLRCVAPVADHQGPQPHYHHATVQMRGTWAKREADVFGWGFRASWP